MSENSFNNTVESLFKGMDSFITTKTVVGDAIHIGDTILFHRRRRTTELVVWVERFSQVQFL